MPSNKKIRVFLLLLSAAFLFSLRSQTVETKDSIPPPAQKSDFLTSDEKQLLGMLNELLIKNKLLGLEADSILTVLAREHSNEMVELKYFSANSPKKGNCRGTSRIS